ncbi:Ger(x)C family spore germination protein [Siminovitchia terrae]|uniref:Ger(x)C family spore germination protein n=1 Tax=Siminovitchia terrae TaxID=1914933 RepID=UPI001B063887|nr:Ger(x)C family spore germination protein [Siminovitchia terrae]GIN92244.1 germination protein [Siminovitchia terrae]
MMGLKNSFVKKSVFLAVFAGGMFFLAGCWDRIEVNDLAIVTATGIDKSEDGQVELSLEIFIPKSMGGGSEGGGTAGGGGKETTMITYHKGSNLADALSKLQAEIPRKVFWGSCKIFIFGEAVAKDGIQEHVDFLLRHPQPRERAFIFVSRGKAKKVLDTKDTLERYSAEALRKVSSSKHGLSVTLQDLDKMLTSRDQNVVLPYLKIEEKSDGKQAQYAVFDGTVLFKEDRMAGTIPKSTTRGLLWIKDKLKDYTVTFELEEEKGNISIFPVKTKVDITPRIQNGEWKVIVDITTEGTVVENGTKLDLDNGESERKVKKAYSDRVEGRIRQAIEEAQDHGLDVVEYGRAFHRKYPQQWKKVKDRWEEVFPEVKTEFHIKASIRRQGYINEPIKAKEEK